jgi:hypothetical protein
MASSISATVGCGGSRRGGGRSHALHDLLELVMMRLVVAYTTTMILDMAGGRVKKVNGDAETH